MYRLERENLCASAASIPERPAGRRAGTAGPVGTPTPALAWGGKVRLTRRYHSGQKMVYATKMHTKAVIHSEPPELQNFLPPCPPTSPAAAEHRDGKGSP